MRIDESSFIFDSEKTIFKFQIPTLASSSISCVVSFYVFCMALMFTAINVDSSSITKTYNGLQVIESENVSYNLLMLPQLSYSNTFYTVFLDLNNICQATCSVEAEFVFLNNDNLNNDVMQIQLLTNPGIQRLFSTGYFTYDMAMAQIHVTFDSYNITEAPKIIIAYGDSIFEKKTIFLRIVFFAISFICFIMNLSSLIIFSWNSIQFESIVSLCGLIFSLASNFPYKLFHNYFGSLTSLCLEYISNGIFSSYTLINLFLCVYKANDGQNIILILIICMIFIVTNALSQLTSDTRISERLFGADLVIWMFFLSITFMARVSLFILIFHNLFQLIQKLSTNVTLNLAMISIKRRNISLKKKANLFNAYIAISFANFFTFMLSTGYFLKSGFSNFAVEYLSNYIMPTFTAMLLVDIHWPQYPQLKPQVIDIIDEKA